jgi:hypothetical protein
MISNEVRRSRATDYCAASYSPAVTVAATAAGLPRRLDAVATVATPGRVTAHRLDQHSARAPNPRQERDEDYRTHQVGPIRGREDLQRGIDQMGDREPYATGTRTRSADQ